MTRLGEIPTPFALSDGVHHALGDPVLQMFSEGTAAAPPVGAPTPRPDPLEQRLDQLIAELQGLRADLASRTLGARLRLGWAWLCRWWRRW
jgi:hypothetical protein